MHDIDSDLNYRKSSNVREYFNNLSETRTMFCWIWQNLLSSWGRSVCRKIFLLGLFSTICSAIQPWSIGKILKYIGVERDLNLLCVWVGVFVFFYLISLHISWREWRWREMLFGEKVEHLSDYATGKFFEKAPIQHITHGHLLNKGSLNKGYERVLHLENLLLFEGLEIILGFSISYIAIWIVAWQVALLLTALIVVVMLWMIPLNQKTMLISAPIDRKFRWFNRVREELWDKVIVVKSNARETDDQRRLTKLFQEAIVLDRKLWLSVIDQMTLRRLLAVLFVIGIVIYGSHRTWYGWMEIDVLFSVLIWSRDLAHHLRRIGDMEYGINSSLPAISTLKRALEMPVALDYSGEFRVSDSLPCMVEFDGVSYTYSEVEETESLDMSVEGGHQVLRNVSFRLEPGISAALIGVSGVGKTTILNLVLRHMDPTEGRVLVDDNDLRHIDIGSWLGRVAYVGQNAQGQLFDDTFRANILYSLPAAERPQVLDEEIWDLMRQLGIDLGKRLKKHGLDTRIGKGGIRLSGGEAQRLIIARSVIKRPKVFIFDEVTAALDSLTEDTIISCLSRVSQGSSALFVAHRLSTLVGCQRFIFLNNNTDNDSSVEAVADSMEELAECSDTFREMAAKQRLILHPSPSAC